MINKLFSLFIFFSFITLNAENISNYTIDIHIQSDGQLEIKEEITYDFEDTPKHGIYRTIPQYLTMNSVKKDLGFDNFYVEMDGHSVNYSVSQHKNINIKIGDPNTLIQGKHTYLITYHVKIGVFPHDFDITKDVTRWNIIGTQWKVPIHNIVSNIYLPSLLNKNNVATKLYTGTYGSQEHKGEMSWINKNQLHIEVEKLNPHEAVTAELTYATGSLGKRGTENFQYSLLEKSLAGMPWFIFFGLLLYFKSTLDKYSTKINTYGLSVQYKEPKNITLLQAALMIDKSADNKDFAPAIIELAYLGYLEIKISRKGAKAILTKTEKTSNNLSEDQKYLLNNILFKNKNTFTLSATKKNSTLLSDGFSTINSKLYDWGANSGYMQNNIKDLRKSYLIKSLYTVLPFILILIYSIIVKYDVLFLTSVPFIALFLASGIAMSKSSNRLFIRFIGLFLIALNSSLLYAYSQEAEVSLVSIIFGPAGILFILMYIWGYVYNRLGIFTQKGVHITRQLLGLKEFLMRVKKDEISRRLKDDPLYLERMLPYAILFNINEHWLEFYDLLDVNTPYWYDGNISNLHTISHQVDHITNYNDTQSSGGTSGGSFSGGGGGGGGGGSW